MEQQHRGVGKRGARSLERVVVSFFIAKANMQKFVIFCTPPHETTFENTTLLTGQKSCNILRVGAGIAYLLPSEVTSFVNPLSVVPYSFLLRAGGKYNFFEVKVRFADLV